MREGIEIALIAAGSGVGGAILTIGWGILGSFLTARSTKKATGAQIAAISAAVRAQIEASADTRPSYMTWSRPACSATCSVACRSAVQARCTTDAYEPARSAVALL